jgi:hypothetical protein
MDTRNLESTVEKAERSELSDTQVDTVVGGACDAGTILGAMIADVAGSPNRLLNTWIKMGCPK